MPLVQWQITAYRLHLGWHYSPMQTLTPWTDSFQSAWHDISCVK